MFMCGYLVWQGSSGAALVSNLIVKPTDISVTIGMDPRSDGCADCGMLCAPLCYFVAVLVVSCIGLFCLSGSFLSEGHSGHTSYLKQILSDQKVCSFTHLCRHI